MVVWDVRDLSKAQELGVSILTSAFGTPLAALVYWTLFSQPLCRSPLDQNVLMDCVVTLSGESWSWYVLAGKPESLAFAFILAGVVYQIFELLKAGGTEAGTPAPL